MRVTYLYDWQRDGGIHIAKWSSLHHCAVCINFHKNQLVASIILTNFMEHCLSREASIYATGQEFPTSSLNLITLFTSLPLDCPEPDVHILLYHTAYSITIVSFH